MNLMGHQKTYQAWYGIDKTTLENNRTFNPAGAIYDEDGNVVDYYDNQTDNYDQNHLHVYWKQKWNQQWRSTATLHWTRGLGYYEEYKQGARLSDYKFNPGDERADLVRRQWLDNHFFGGILNLEARNLGDWDLYLGAALNHYIGGHYGTVEEIEGVNLNSDHKYYQNESLKTEFSSYVKAKYTLSSLEIFGDVQFRTIGYDADYKNDGANEFKDFFPYNFSWTFVNPKAGITYRMLQSKIYLSYGLTHREPTRSDILANVDHVKPETLHDVELGFRTNQFLDFGINGYYMYYLDQLVLTGQIDDVGNPVRENVGKSYRAGVEMDVSKMLLRNHLNLFGNFAWSHNKNLDYQVLQEDGTLLSMGKTTIAYTPEIVTSFGMDVYPIENLKLNWTNKYVSEQFITNFEAPDGKLDAFFIVDALANYNLTLNKTQLDFTFMVNNIFNKMYANNAYYAGETYYFPQAGRNFMMGLKISL
jgi:iron complex outermembrane receptor protein